MSYLPPIVALGDAKESGKDATAEHLKRKFGYVVMGMSDPLNDALLALNPLIPTHTHLRQDYVRYQDFHAEHGYVEAKRNPEVRRLLQALGTEVGRDMIGANTWVNMAKTRIEEVVATGRGVALTGVRFPNELAMVEQLGALTVWVNRPRNHTAALTEHSSETSVEASMFQETLKNDGTLEQLHERADKLILDHSRGARANRRRRVADIDWPIYDH